MAASPWLLCYASLRAALSASARAAVSTCGALSVGVAALATAIGRLPQHGGSDAASGE